MSFLTSKKIYEAGRTVINRIQSYNNSNALHEWKHAVPEEGIQRRNFFTAHDLTNKNKEYAGRKLVGYTMEQMFTVVADVGNYNKFLPWCKKSIIVKPGIKDLKADLVIGFPPLNESYTSHVTMMKPHLVKAECTDGRLFNYLLTLWRFSPGLKDQPQSCVVDFQVSFEFRSMLHLQLSNLFFNQVVKQMENSFIEEVGRRYGKPSITSRNLIVENS